MKRVVTEGVVLGRINYGESARILTVLTPDQGKLRLMAKGVRKERSKLAGGIELFCVNSITYIPGKGDIGTLVSSRLKVNLGDIVNDISKTMFGYDILKLLDKVTQEECDKVFYDLAVETLTAINNRLNLALIEDWFAVRTLRALGHEPNFSSDTEGNKLDSSKRYEFDFEKMAFTSSNTGQYSSRHIKLLRLFLTQPIKKLIVIEEIDKIATELQKPLKIMLIQFV